MKSPLHILYNRVGEKKSTGIPHIRRRYRVEIINENTLERSWSLVLSGVRVIIAAVAVVAALASLITVIFMFTPVGNLLPGHLKGDERAGLITLGLKVDSLNQVAREYSSYTDNLRAILLDSADTSLPDGTAGSALSAIPVDSLIEAGQAEREFVRRFEEDARYNLSVLSPIAAEGMTFDAPTSTPQGIGSVSAVYRGAVISESETPSGRFNVVIQHPNDFISIYANLSDSYVSRGDKIIAGQRIGNSTTEAPLLFELWHSGTQLDPALYIYYPTN